MANRLAGATSPYLLQHADNPVDWWEWGDDAFAEAARRDVPVFLSVGYAACHWCHVMAHESFEDEATASALNSGFVCVKVDREERPDVDAVYMGATQAMTGQGGWPMSVMLTPTGEPFFAGTYFPPSPRHGMPAFRQVLEAVSQAWRDRRTDLEAVAADVTAHLRATPQRSSDPTAAGTSAELDYDAIGGGAVARLMGEYDATFAGFGRAPKFPPSMVCEFLLRRAARTGDADALAMAEGTLTAMARGGIFDQLGGGFARYSVDAQWAVPHFEKMLYDNALLLPVYVHWWRLTGSDLASSVVRSTVDFMLRELRTAEGGFASSLDADSDGREGAYYVWTPAELKSVLGDDEGAAAARFFGVTQRGNVEGGGSTLRSAGPPPAPDQVETWRAALAAARAQRVRPARDDKIVAAWNGFAIGALAEAAVLFGEPDWLAAAVDCARLVTGLHRTADGGLRRVSRDGVVGHPHGVLEDYACLSEGLLMLYSATGETEWFEQAAGLLHQARERFAADDGGYFDTDAGAETLVARPRDQTDNATPSGTATMAAVLTSMHALTGDEVLRREAEGVVAALTGVMAEAPRFAGKALSVAEALADGPAQLAVVGPTRDPARSALVEAGFRLTRPGLVIAQGTPDEAAVQLLAGRTPVGGEPAAYLCHDFVCDLPVVHPEALRADGV